MPETDVLTRPRTVLMRASGDSMRPSVRPGDWLFVSEGPARLRVGDVAAFRRGPALVIHRVVSLRPRRQMGDASDGASGFAPGDVVGTILAVAGPRGVTDLTTPARRLQGRIIALRGLARLALRRVRAATPIRTTR